MIYDKCQEAITIRRQAFSSTLRLTVNRHGKITLSAPLFCSQATIQSFIQSHLDWITAQRTKPRLVFQNHMTFSLLGQSLTICHNPAGHGTTCHNSILSISGDISFLNRRVCHYIQKQTALYIQQKATEMASALGVRFHAIHLKDTTSRWGSCSSQSNLNFSWRLGLAPLFVLDYIIAHEVSHLKEMNHSPAFWATVARLCSCRSEAEIWLRRYGHTLY